MNSDRIKIEQLELAALRAAMHRWELACRAVRYGIVPAEHVIIDPAWVAKWTASSPELTRDEIVARIRSSLTAAMPQHTEISVSSAAAIDASHNRDPEGDINEFWRHLDTRLQDAEREYP